MKTELPQSPKCPAPIKEKLVSSKKSKQLKQLFATLAEQGHEIYVCIKDMKSGEASQFSSDASKFSLDSF
jgi:predicted peroxiredoxin